VTDKTPKYVNPLKGQKAPLAHKTRCSVCLHEQCKEIEKAFIDWKDRKEICKEYGVSYDALGRHIRYFRLKDKRAKNYVKILDRLLEMGMISEDLHKKFKISDIKDIIALKAKLDGELVDKSKITIDGKIDNLSEDTILKALGKLGVKVEETEDD